MFIDDEKRILSQYLFNDTSFHNGISNFEWLVVNNINNSGKYESIYKYNREDESHLKEVYERIVLYITSIYFDPNHKANRKYMKSAELYICSYIFVYFDNLFKRNDNEINHYMELDEYGYKTRSFNSVGKVAMKVYLASAIVLNKAGLIADYNIENIKDYIRNNRY